MDVSNLVVLFILCHMIGELRWLIQAFLMLWPHCANPELWFPPCVALYEGRGACAEVDSDTEAVAGVGFKLGCISCKKRTEVIATATVEWYFRGNGEPDFFHVSANHCWEMSDVRTRCYWRSMLWSTGSVCASKGVLVVQASLKSHSFRQQLFLYACIHCKVRTRAPLASHTSHQSPVPRSSRGHPEVHMQSMVIFHTTEIITALEPWRPRVRSWSCSCMDQYVLMQIL